MAIIKHIKSRNANYSDALDYLLFQHDEKTNLPILDEQGRKQLRDEFYMDGLNCDAMFFDTECKKTNAFFHKNKKRNDIKSHHYIISFDPADATECGLTGERAQELCLEFAKKNFPGYQALIVTHTDGHNNSGNIHTHIVINSVRKFAVERAYYMDKPHEESAGYKHRSTTKFLRHLQKEVMEMCEKEGLHQIDLFSPAPEKMTKEEYWVKTHGQEKLDKLNQEIISDGLQPVQTTFQTQKQYLRDAIDECARISKDFEDFQSQLLDKYNISVIQQRGTYRYLHPDRFRRITEKSLGANYGKEYLEQLFTNYGKTQTSNLDYRKDPYVIFYIKSELRLVTDLQSNVKAMQNEAYARKVKISNLQQMANTLIFVQDQGYDTQEELLKHYETAKQKLSSEHEKLLALSSEMDTLNKQIHFTGQYHSSKKCFSEFVKAKNKKTFRQAHSSELSAYEEARDWLKEFYPDGKMLSMKSLNQKKSTLQEELEKQKSIVAQRKKSVKEFDIVTSNVNSIFHMDYTESKLSDVKDTQKYQHSRKETSL
ncbi:MAG: relaxase/mobilization nuclease domain-containing protein [Clostridiales bacterium]|nr:relaxase/mobilization nuclease domain-containing protein [Clostridiales bacterium]